MTAILYANNQVKGEEEFIGTTFYMQVNNIAVARVDANCTAGDVHRIDCSAFHGYVKAGDTFCFNYCSNPNAPANLVRVWLNAIK